MLYMYTVKFTALNDVEKVFTFCEYIEDDLNVDYVGFLKKYLESCNSYHDIAIVKNPSSDKSFIFDGSFYSDTDEFIGSFEYLSVTLLPEFLEPVFVSN